MFLRPFLSISLTLACVVPLQFTSAQTLQERTKSVTAECLANDRPRDIEEADPNYVGGLTRQYVGRTPAKAPGAITVGSAFASCFIKELPFYLTVISATADDEGLPSAVSVVPIGFGGSFLDTLQKRSETALNMLTGGDFDRPIIIYCHHVQCFLSYNAVLRAVHAGYHNIFWLREGIGGWKASNMKTASIPRLPIDTAWDEGVKQIRAAAKKDAAEEGVRLIEPLRAAYMQNGERQYYAFSLKAGKRYIISGQCDEDCTDIDLGLVDGRGGVPILDRNDDDTPVLEVTPTTTGEYQLMVTMADCGTAFCWMQVIAFEVDESPTSQTASTVPKAEIKPLTAGRKQTAEVADSSLLDMYVSSMNRVAAVPIEAFEKTKPHLKLVSNGNGATVYVDKDGRTKSGNRRSGDVWMMFSEAKQLGNGSVFDTIFFNLMANCKDNSGGALEGTIYHRGRRVGTTYLVAGVTDLELNYNSAVSELCR
ncbi:MAG: rhodanese-like domain-containing protein [Gemmatimonas sp.]